MGPKHALAALALLQTGCASLVTGPVANALSGTGSGLGRDEDPELIADAAPFGLKTMEAVLVSEPEHVGLLTALAGGFVQYAFAFVDMPSDVIAADDLGRGQAMKARAKKLYLRARGYALQGLDVEHEGLSAKLRAQPAEALADTEVEDVPLLYWAAASWGLAIATDKNDTLLVAEFPVVLELARRALALDPTWNDGAVHELMMSLELARPDGSPEVAREHFDAAVALSKGLKAGPYVSYAESVTVKQQKIEDFRALLNKALAIDVDAEPDQRLANIIVQRRARWLLSRTDDLFLGDAPPSEEEGAPTP